MGGGTIIRETSELRCDILRVAASHRMKRNRDSRLEAHQYAQEKEIVDMEEEHDGYIEGEGFRIELKRGSMIFREEDVPAEHREKCVKVVIPSGVTEIGNDAFWNNGKLESVELPPSVVKIGRDAFGWCHSLKSINLPQGLKTIGEGAFNDCRSLEELAIPQSVTEIGDCALLYCESLKEIDLPPGLTKINDNVFSECRSLTQITIPSGVREIGKRAFSNCFSLKKIDIPIGLMKIGEEAFRRCALESIYLPQEIKEIGDRVFECCPLMKVIYVDKGTEEMVKGLVFGALGLDYFYKTKELKFVATKRQLLGKAVLDKKEIAVEKGDKVKRLFKCENGSIIVIDLIVGCRVFRENEIMVYCSSGGGVVDIKIKKDDHRRLMKVLEEDKEHFKFV